MPITIRQFACWFEPGKVSHLSVPLYHRSYSWESNNVSELFPVIERVVLDKNSKKSIHLGDIYLTSCLFSDNDPQALEIVDGAHRVITTVLMFCAIRDRIQKTVKKVSTNPAELSTVDPTVSEIMCLLKHNNDWGNPGHKFVAADEYRDREILASIIDGHTMANGTFSLLPPAFKQIQQWLSKVEKKDSLSMKRLAEFLMDRVVFNAYFVEYKMEALKLYEYLNTSSDDEN